ncbi:MAG: tail fiber domain-containing protein [bacterium]
MAILSLSSDTANKISFKKLVGKAHTQENFQSYEETQTSNVSIGSNTIFGETIDRNPTALTNIYDTDGIVEKIKFEVEIIPNTKKSSNNQSQGYRLKLPSDYVTSGGSKSSEYSAGTILYNTLGDLQVVPQLFGNSYKPVLYETDGTTVIEEFDTINWVLDAYSGIIFVQDPPNGYDSSSDRPGFIEAFLYVGKYVNEIVSSASSSGVSITLFNSYTGSTEDKIDFLSAATSGLSSGSTIISSDKQIIFNNSGTTSGNTELVYEYAERALTLGSRASGSIGNNSVTFGQNNIASGNTSFSHGKLTIAREDFSHAEGCSSDSIGVYSHAEGARTCSVGSFSHSEGDRTCSVGLFSHSEGSRTTSYGLRSHSEGYLTISTGINSHSEGRNAIACGNGSHVEGFGTRSIGVYSHAEGRGSRSLGDTSHAEGYYTISSGNCSHSEGIRTISFGVASHAQGCGIIGREVIASGSPSFNFSINNANQVPGHGALATSSAILGGANHNIAGGNTGATIIGGCGIKLTGTNYINYTAVDNLAIFTDPDSSSLSNALVWDSVDKKVKINSSLGGGVGGSDTEIQFNNSGTLSGNSEFTFEYVERGLTLGSRTGTTGIRSIVIGNNNLASGNQSMSIGEFSCAEANNSLSIGQQACALGNQSFALGSSVAAIGAGSFSLGFNSFSCGDNSFAIGQSVITCTNSDGSVATGLGGSTAPIISSGQSAFNHSSNDSNQQNGHGANAHFSSILGGRNHNIEVGNTGATIIGGCGIKLTGSNYINYTAVDNLAIFTDPDSSSLSNALVWDSVDKKVKINSSLGGGVGGSDTEIQFNNSGTLSGNAGLVYEYGQTALTLGSRAAGSIGNNSFSQGENNLAYSDFSHAEGKNTKACGLYSHAEGYNTNACGNISHTEGQSTYAFGISSHAEGYNTQACGSPSHAEGIKTAAIGIASHSEGEYTKACGFASHSQGMGILNREVIAFGSPSFNFSLNNGDQVVGHGALADTSAILGGANHNIEVGNTGATIIGGCGIKLTGSNYINYTAVGNLAIWETPTTDNSTDDVLVYDQSSKKVVRTSKAGISDARLKTNLKPLVNNLSGVTKLNTYEFNYDTSKINDYCKHYGLLAQDVEKVFPYVVKQNHILDSDKKDNTIYKTIDYRELVPILFGAIKEMNTEINSLKEKVNKLENK